MRLILSPTTDIDVAHGISASDRTLLEDLEVSSFVAGLLGSGELAIVSAALQLAQLLMAKLPDVFRTHFVKEGVVHAIDKLAASAPEEVRFPA